jgi:hypothetical protein
MIRKFIVTGVAVGTLTTAAQAEQVVATNPTTIVRSLQGAGYRAELGKDGTGDPLISSSSSGSGFQIYFYGCAKNSTCKTVQFSASYEDAKPSLSRINEWNSGKRWGQAFIQDDGSARVQMDVDLEKGGMPTVLFVDNLEYWVATMSTFEKFIADR